MPAQTDLSPSLETIVCPLCGTDESRHLARLADRLGVTDEPFQVGECAGCGHVFVNPRPRLDDLGRFYPTAYWHTAAAEAARPGLSLVTAVKALEARYRRSLLWEDVRRVLKLVPPGSRMLDVGCGSGDILVLAAERGLQVTGVEFAPEAVAYAREARGLDVRQGTLEDARFEDASFDVVTMWHVLEHVPDPVGTLREVRRVLKPGGAVVVQVPNYGGLQARLFRERWYGLDVPRHLHHFTPRTLRRAFEAARLEWRALDHRSFRCNPVIFVSSLLPALEPHAFSMRERRGESQLVQKALYLALTWVFAPWTEVESLLGGGAVITAVGKAASTLPGH